MVELVLIRGLPGSGKTTMAKAMDGYARFEADQWMINDAGVYHFDPHKLSAVHEACRAATKRALKAGHNVVVSNTFVKRKQMKPYLEMGYPVRVLEAKGDFESLHNVPKHVIEEMRELWETYAD